MSSSWAINQPKSFAVQKIKVQLITIGWRNFARITIRQDQVNLKSSILSPHSTPWRQIKQVVLKEYQVTLSISQSSVVGHLHYLGKSGELHSESIRGDRRLTVQCGWSLLRPRQKDLELQKLCLTLTQYCKTFHYPE